MFQFQTLLLLFVGWWCSNHVLLAVDAAEAAAIYTKDALFTAVQDDDPTGIGQAIDDGADINQIGTGGQTPLVHAVLTGKLNAVKTLLTLGADTSLAEKDGYNVMHAAGFQGRAEILKTLLNHGEGLAPLMTKHSDGYYPLHRACWGREERHAETVKVFIEEGGVDYNFKSQHGNGCLDMTHNPATKEVLMEAHRKSQAEEL
jgi:ankyrin repeat protein